MNNNLKNFLQEVETKVNKYILFINEDNDKDYSKNILATLSLAGINPNLPQVKLNYYNYYDDINTFLKNITIPRLLIIEIRNNTRIVLADLKLMELK